MAMMQCTELRIGTSVATLLQLRYRGIPDPDDWPYRPYSVVRTTGTGEVKSYGFPTASWSWTALDQASIGVLLDFFAADTDASVQVYISTYTDTGRKRATSDFTAYMLRPVDGEGKAMYPGSQGRVSQDVTISFTHLEAA
jgi:hypothetical protein